jgi:predicted lipoprotein with Yx(FWY)xxD motif
MTNRARGATRQRLTAWWAGVPLVGRLIAVFTVLLSLGLLLAGVAAATLLAACASMSQPMPAKVADGALVGPGGMSLDTFDRDPAGAGKSVCNGPCAANWPPLKAGMDANAMGDWSIVVRDDGSRQWAYKGKPLYTFANDHKPGDITGDGFLNGAWHIAKP